MKSYGELTAALAVGLLLPFGAVADAAEAKANWDKHCAKCHGVDGKGQTKMGQRLGAKDYTDPKVQAAVTDEAAFAAIKNGLKSKEGKELMKPAESLTDEEINALVSYIRQFKK